MSAVKIHVPVVRLAKLLRTPGGLPVVDAVKRAGAGLESLRAECLDELRVTLDQAELCAGRANGEYDPAVAEELYAIASAAIGVPTACGLAPIDTALVSLADLTDYLKTRKTWDPNAVAVHLRAFRLLLHTEAGKDSNGTKAILEGLRRVSQRYAKPESPSAAAG